MKRIFIFSNGKPTGFSVIWMGDNNLWLLFHDRFFKRYSVEESLYVTDLSTIMHLLGIVVTDVQSGLYDKFIRR